MSYRLKRTNSEDSDFIDLVAQLDAELKIIDGDLKIEDVLQDLKDYIKEIK